MTINGKHTQKKNFEPFLPPHFRPSTKQNISARAQTKKKAIINDNKEMAKMVHVT